MSEKNLRRVYYALVNLSKGDTLSALVTVNTDLNVLIGASGFLHRRHPCHPDFAVFRSTAVGYFGEKVVVVAFNGELVKE